MTSEPLTMTLVKAAKLLGISRNGAYNAANAGQIPTIRIGKRILVPIAALEKLLQSPKINFPEIIEQAPPPKKIGVRISLVEWLYDELRILAQSHKRSIPEEIIDRLHRSLSNSEEMEG